MTVKRGREYEEERAYPFGQHVVAARWAAGSPRIHHLQQHADPVFFTSGDAHVHLKRPPRWWVLLPRSRRRRLPHPPAASDAKWECRAHSKGWTRTCTAADAFWHTRVCQEGEPETLSRVLDAFRFAPEPVPTEFPDKIDEVTYDHNSLAWSPDGSQLAYGDGTGQTGVLAAEGATHYTPPAQDQPLGRNARGSPEGRCPALPEGDGLRIYAVLFAQ